MGPSLGHLVATALALPVFCGIASARQTGEPVPAAKAAASTATPVPSKGTPRLDVYFTKGFEDAAWQQAAFGKVAKSWAASAAPAVGKKAVVIATITREGKLLDARLGTPSGSEGWDKAALDAVKKAAPFPALPKSWTDSSLEAHFHFEYGK